MSTLFIFQLSYSTELRLWFVYNFCLPFFGSFFVCLFCSPFCLFPKFKIIFCFCCQFLIEFYVLLFEFCLCAQCCSPVLLTCKNYVYLCLPFEDYLFVYLFVDIQKLLLFLSTFFLFKCKNCTFIFVYLLRFIFFVYLFLFAFLLTCFSFPFLLYFFLFTVVVYFDPIISKT